jgi:hypothetical protein
MCEEVKIEQRSGSQVMNEEKDTQHEARDDKTDEHPKGLQLTLLTLSLMFAVFIMALDTTILCMLNYILTRFQATATDCIKPRRCRESRLVSTASNMSDGIRAPTFSR